MCLGILPFFTCHIDVMLHPTARLTTVQVYHHRVPSNKRSEQCATDVFMQKCVSRDRHKAGSKEMHFHTTSPSSRMTGR